MLWAKESSRDEDDQRSQVGEDQQGVVGEDPQLRFLRLKTRKYSRLASSLERSGGSGVSTNLPATSSPFLSFDLVLLLVPLNPLLRSGGG